MQSNPNEVPVATAVPRYWAFISYSHRDRKWGDWLHRSLENYRIPKALVAAGAPARILPVFRDREELAGAVNLTNKIETALAESRNLIVVCSPRSAASRWVDEEIRRFAALRRADRIFVLIVDGEPHAQNPEVECLPAALRFELLPDGQLGDHSADYLAADARAEGDGKKNALLKLAAGLIDADFDKLKHRDQERQISTRATWTGALVVLTLLFASRSTTSGAEGGSLQIPRWNGRSFHRKRRPPREVMGMKSPRPVRMVQRVWLLTSAALRLALEPDSAAHSPRSPETNHDC